jgi:peptidoglycan/xylan/chitin deacetylase (PgdA/CDA1 family)
MYHRVAHDGRDPHHLQVSPEHFAAHLEWLRSTAAVVPLTEALERKDHARVVLTLDDGYVDNLTEAKPLLERLGLPATVFVTSGLVGSRRGFWVDRLASLLLDGGTPPPERHLALEIAGRAFLLDIGSAPARVRAHALVHHRLRRLPPAEIDAVIADISRALARTPTVPEDCLPLSVDELRQLADGGTVTIGAHTVTHAMLSSLTERDQRDELERGREQLEAILGGAVQTLAYPYGDELAFDATSVKLARETFDLAVTAQRGDASVAPDPHRLPRVYVGDWAVDELAARLALWLST